MCTFPLKKSLPCRQKRGKVEHDVVDRGLIRPHIEVNGTVVRAEFQLMSSANNRQIIGEIELRAAILSGRSRWRTRPCQSLRRANKNSLHP